MKKWLAACIIILLAIMLTAHGTRAMAAPALQLVSDLPSNQPVGTKITWTLLDAPPQPHSYRLSIQEPGEVLRVMVDFKQENSFAWTPIEEGLYRFVGSVRDDSTGQITTVSQSFRVTPRATTQPVLSATDHPLVALYSAPPCAEGNDWRVAFRRQGALHIFRTPAKPCQGGKSMNSYVAGMREQSSYQVRHELIDEAGTVLARGPQLLFQTGASERTPPLTVPVSLPPASASLAEGIILQTPSRGTIGFDLIPFATDLSGALVWYYPVDESLVTRVTPQGTMLMLEPKDDVAYQVWREVDVAGNTIRETTVARVNEQLAAMGYAPLTSFHHEATRFPSGHTLVLGSTLREVEVEPGAEPEMVLGDVIVDLDENWQVAWVWDAFDHLDVSREAVLDEKCWQGRNSDTCPLPLANDWLHSNAVTYSPQDGNLLLSIRHQDWVIKLDYQDGAGTGAVIWRLGLEGDFSIQPPNQFAWFSHQHDAYYINENQIILYDNGNTRCAVLPSPCHSRGQVYQLDEEARTASLVLNSDLGNYTFAGANGQPLQNGNFYFTSGQQFGPSGPFGTMEEVAPDGSILFTVRTEGMIYRSFRLKDLYTPPTDSVSP